MSPCEGHERFAPRGLCQSLSRLSDSRGGTGHGRGQETLLNPYRRLQLDAVAAGSGRLGALANLTLVVERRRDVLATLGHVTRVSADVKVRGSAPDHLALAFAPPVTIKCIIPGIALLGAPCCDCYEFISIRAGVIRLQRQQHARR